MKKRCQCLKQGGQMNNYECCICFERNLSKNTVGINKKLLGNDINRFYCLNCLSDYLGCEVEELLEKIQEFKNEGCTLFE